MAGYETFISGQTRYVGGRSLTGHEFSIYTKQKRTNQQKTCTDVIYISHFTFYMHPKESRFNQSLPYTQRILTPVSWFLWEPLPPCYAGSNASIGGSKLITNRRIKKLFENFVQAKTLHCQPRLRIVLPRSDGGSIFVSQSFVVWFHFTSG